MRQTLQTSVEPLAQERLTEERGQTVLEFALTLTVTLLLIFGLIEFSRVIYASSVIQWAAQQGARAGIADLANVVPAVGEKLVGLNQDQITIVVTQPEADLVQVNVTYRFEFIVPTIVQLTGDHLDLQASASMVIE